MNLKIIDTIYIFSFMCPVVSTKAFSSHFFRFPTVECVTKCLVAEPDKELVGELKEWVAYPLGPGQT